jgi:hypothetical protein
VNRGIRLAFGGMIALTISHSQQLCAPSNAPANYSCGCMQTTYRSVPAEYNMGDTDGHCAAKITSGHLIGALPFACPEYIRRFYDKAFQGVDVSHWWSPGNGKDYYLRSSAFGLAANPNCVSGPAPGQPGTGCNQNSVPRQDDIVSFCNYSQVTGQCDLSLPGHVAIVNGPVVSTGTTFTVTLIEQNWSKTLINLTLAGIENSGISTIFDRRGECIQYTSSKPITCVSYAYYRVQGWLRVPITVSATLDGVPWSGSVSYQLSSPSGTVANLGTSVPAGANQLNLGLYSLTYNGGAPSNSSFVGVGPSASQVLTNASTITFALQFTSNPPTAGFTISANGQTVPNSGGPLALSVQPGGGVNVTFDASVSSAVNGATITRWQWMMNGSPIAGVGSRPSFSSYLYVGNFVVSLVVTDSRGISSIAATGTVGVTQTGPSSGFSPTASMNEARVYHTATLLNDGTVLVTGGGIGGPQTPSSSTAEIYVPSSGTWHYTAYPMNSGRTTHMAIKLNDGRVLIAGGYNEAILNSCEIYDPSTGQFTPTGSMNAGHSNMPMVLLDDGRVMVVEGNIAYYTYPTPPSEIYDPTSGTWSIVPSPAVGIALSPAVTLNNGNVLAISGYDGCCALSFNVQLINPATNALTSMVPLVVARLAESATTLLDGRVLIVAGTDWAQTINSTEIYDASVLPNGSSQLGSPLSAARRAHTATLLSNGDVLVVAGYQAPNSGQVAAYLSSAELWNHITGLWSSAGSLPSGVQAHTATLLASGAVLVAGGGNPTPVNTASIWNP